MAGGATPGGALPRVHAGRHRRRRRRAAVRRTSRRRCRSSSPTSSAASRWASSSSRSTTAGSRTASTRASASPTSSAPCASSTSSTRSAPRRSRRCSSSRARRPSRPTSASRWPPSARPTSASSSRCAPSASSTRCSTRGSSRWPTSSAPAWPRTRQDRRRPAHRRGLDYYTGTVYETQFVGHEEWGSFCSGGRYDALASDGRTTYPGVGISIGVTRILGLLIGRGLSRRHARPRRRCSSRSPTTSPSRGRRDRDGPAPTGHRLRGRSVGGEVRQADPLRRAPRHTVRVVPGGRGARRGQGHPLRRAGAGRPGVVDPAHGGPAPPGHPHRRPLD